MAKLTRKLWIGIGAVAIAGTPVADKTAAQHAQHQGAAAKKGADKDKGSAGAAAASSQQGGETYLTEGRPKDTRIFYYRSIALIHGHLRVGHELIEEGLWDEALPHFLHPTEELYDQIAPYMKGQGIAPFNAQLKALAQTVKAKKREAYDAARLSVQMRLDRALDGARKFMTPMRPFTVKTVVEVLKVAVEEYRSSIDGETISLPVEYQDSRGFVWQAQQMFEDVAPELEKIDDKATRDVRWTFAELKSAWPMPLPPSKPVLTADAVEQRVKRIEELAAKLDQ
jgi:hypothetical protein